MYEYEMDPACIVEHAERAKFRPRTSGRTHVCETHLSTSLKRGHNMTTSSNGYFLRVTGHLCMEITGPRRSFDSFINLGLNKR